MKKVAAVKESELASQFHHSLPAVCQFPANEMNRVQTDTV